MPIETAQYIDTLQPDWPDGKDPESEGDDHIRMTKQVLKNQFPNLNGAVSGTPEQINNITLNTPWVDNSATAGALSNFRLTNPKSGDGTLANMEQLTPTLEQYNTNPALSLTWQVVMTAIYPIGSVIFNTGTNPATILGFGTWTQRSGTIYGAGDCADGNAYNRNIAPGEHNTDAFWRIQNLHIVGQSLTLAMNPLDPHSHDYDFIANTGSGMQIDATYDAFQKIEQQTSSVSAGTPSGTVSIGTDTYTTGSQFMTPGYAFYVWERTA